MKRNFIRFVCFIMMASCMQACVQNAAVSKNTSSVKSSVASEEKTFSSEKDTSSSEKVVSATIADGVYTAAFNTDSAMFHVNEIFKGRGILTVENGNMRIHVSLTSKNILNLYQGLAEDAQKGDAKLLQPTQDTVSYPDGLTETVHGFDISVPYLDKEFDCALIGKKGVWYDHKVSVSDVQEYMPEDDTETAHSSETAGEMMIEVTLSGGSGRAKIESPCKLEQDESGEYLATIVWGSKNYEFMLIGEMQYDPIQEEGNSTFRIPVQLDEDMQVSAQTVAMSEPHLVDYVLFFDSTTITGQ